MSTTVATTGQKIRKIVLVLTGGQRSTGGAVFNYLVPLYFAFVTAFKTAPELAESGFAPFKL